MLFFEDAINGIEAAKSAGAFCVGITSSFSGDELLDAGADSIIQTFFDDIKPVSYTHLTLPTKRIV